MVSNVSASVQQSMKAASVSAPITYNAGQGEPVIAQRLGTLSARVITQSSGRPFAAPAVSCPITGQYGSCPATGQRTITKAANMSPNVPNVETPWGGGCPWQCEKTEFKRWCKAAIENPMGNEKRELYGFLSECFLDADGDRDGRIGPDEFDFLIEKAAAIPRRFGLAPSWSEAYGDISNRMQARQQMFNAMNVDHTGKIGLEEWIRFSIAHITEKVRSMDNTMDFQHLEKHGQEEMVKYCAVAVRDPHSEQYKSLYEHLFKTFVESDVEENGAIRREQFDVLIEDAAKAPRVVGLAPSSSQTYATEAHKNAARDQMFQAMDTNGTGLITFDKFLAWSVEHIAGKVQAYGMK